MQERSSWFPQRLRNSEECFSQTNLKGHSDSVEHETELQHTLSRASAYDESILAAAGALGSGGALFCIPRAIWDIRRRTELLGPNETVCRDRGFLLKMFRPIVIFIERECLTLMRWLHGKGLEQTHLEQSIHHQTER